MSQIANPTHTFEGTIVYLRDKSNIHLTEIGFVHLQDRTILYLTSRTPYEFASLSTTLSFGSGFTFIIIISLNISVKCALTY